MSGAKAIVLDANILIRAVLGQKVRNLILTHADARNYLPPLLEKLPCGMPMIGQS